MGTFSVRIEVGDQDGRRTEALEALVDTGATNTVLLAALLRKLGIEPHTRSTFQFADGSQLELDVGRAWVRVDGQREFTQVVFGAEGTDPILGAITLEEMGLAVDPVARRLVPVTKLLM